MQRGSKLIILIGMLMVAEVYAAAASTDKDATDKGASNTRPFDPFYGAMTKLPLASKDLLRHDIDTNIKDAKQADLVFNLLEAICCQKATPAQVATTLHDLLQLKFLKRECLKNLLLEHLNNNPEIYFAAGKAPFHSVCSLLSELAPAYASTTDTPPSSNPSSSESAYGDSEDQKPNYSFDSVPPAFARCHAHPNLLLLLPPPSPQGTQKNPKTALS